MNKLTYIPPTCRTLSCASAPILALSKWSVDNTDDSKNKTENIYIKDGTDYIEKNHFDSDGWLDIEG